MQVIYKEITTYLDDFSIFSLFKNEKEVIFLDSSMKDKILGRYSIIVFNPFLSFKGKESKFKIERGNNIEFSEGSSFEKLRELLNEYQFINDTPLPFIAGGVGYLAYDLCNEIENIPKTTIDDVNIPDIYFNFYKGSIVIDNILNKVYAGHLKDAECESYFEFVTEKIIKGKTANFNDEKLTKNKNIKANFSKQAYLDTIKKVRNYIKQGEVYEVNLTQRMECPLNKESYDIYQNLRKINKAPFSAFMNLEGITILSSSPERFIKIKDRNIETRPIKGTMRRGRTKEEDEQNKTFLQNSEKDQAENLMIVDLVRNDLSKICKKRTVKVQDLFKIEEYPTVFQLVSTVAGKLKDEVDIVECLQATFPGGSITGAPKIRSMEIIDELEPNQRNIYTGSIGYLGYDGNMDLNIVIRTIVIKENKAYFGVGGAITWDSNEEEEYRETLDKGHALMRVL
ncbi:aminodeoxychorismate synthase, subunit I [Desulfonispora thiosulfatigenes DSM 11270]|uniref:Anthranilate synthase component 1 n=1 Tax=Desulfonispora thiosulfatigenes DSM 11270 TaxID=656914 RepID=A0A1W1VTW5_DESTI|nr:aminodeoxychorismate synthase component I [Desulfonispora thiosulfatigenes]SMB96334.1 aminodeoxychorismate synthase, subunit I [Desulfonispora thiosulfatigenes DSM 11270]